MDSNLRKIAYGQTGSGKTYTMSGDISDQFPLPDKAGIIPRVLHELFAKLDSLQNSPTSSATPDNSVKVSFVVKFDERHLNRVLWGSTTGRRVL